VQSLSQTLEVKEAELVFQHHFRKLLAVDHQSQRFLSNHLSNKLKHLEQVKRQRQQLQEMIGKSILDVIKSFVYITSLVTVILCNRSPFIYTLLSNIFIFIPYFLDVHPSLHHLELAVVPQALVEHLCSPFSVQCHSK